MPISNALIQATPRNALLGGVSDFLAQSYSPERTQHMQGIAQFLAIPQISRTLDRLSYGEPLTTGAGGLGGTTRFNNDALDAMMAVAPMVGPSAKAVGQGTMMAGRAGEKLAERVVPQVMQRGGLPAEMLSAMGNRTVSPLDVYHGTPHTLPPTPRNPLGEFDASKIGTGEGAQAYGHGLYFAENLAVAQEYQAKLSNTGSAKNLADKFGGVDQGIAEAQRRVDHYTQLIANGGGGMPERAEGFLRISQKNLRDLQDMKAGLPENKGSLYKINLPDEKIAKMLDWDKHLSEQAPEIQNILLPYQKEIGSSFGTGEQTLKAIAFERRMKGLDDSPAAVAQQLKDMGIPGIKYLDASSRGTGGTRNFVVFPGEEKSMTILERNGQKFNNSALMK